MNGDHYKHRDANPVQCREDNIVKLEGRMNSLHAARMAENIVAFFSNDSESLRGLRRGTMVITY